MNTPISLAPLLQRFFTQRLMQQRRSSPHTISSYRDTFRQFLKFIAAAAAQAALTPDIRGDRCSLDRGFLGRVGEAPRSKRSQS